MRLESAISSVIESKRFQTNWRFVCLPVSECWNCAVPRNWPKFRSKRIEEIFRIPILGRDDDKIT